VVDMGMNHHTEQEWQFTARDLDSARSWLAAQPHDASVRRLASRPTLTMRDTYYDSPDWMIFRAGFALRVREAREADDTGIGETEVTLKSLHRAHHGIARRTEISESIGSASSTMSWRATTASAGASANWLELVSWQHCFT
jgi:inorganic triphosphatase YgiF